MYPTLFDFLNLFLMYYFVNFFNYRTGWNISKPNGKRDSKKIPYLSGDRKPHTYPHLPPLLMSTWECRWFPRKSKESSKF